MSESLKPPDVVAVTKALRNYNAAWAAWERAKDEFKAVVPPGVVVLHCLPGEAGRPGTLYWSNSFDTNYGLLKGVSDGKPTRGERAVIIEAPGDEVAPRFIENKLGQSHHAVGADEFCTGCGQSRKCRAVVETPGRIDCWCGPCWDEFIGLAYEAREGNGR